MPKTLYGKLTLLLVLQLVATAALMIYFLGIMIEDPHVQRRVTMIVVGCFIFSLVVGLMLFRPLIRRIQELSNVVTDYESSNFVALMRIPSTDPKGDEVDRLGYAVGRMAHRMAEQLQKLQDSDEQRRELIANVSHDLRTPLASIRGYLETALLKEGSIGREELRNYLEVAAKQSERLGKLVANLFELTKLEVLEVTLNREGYSIAELIQDVTQKFELMGSQKGVSVKADVGVALPMVCGDIGLMERVLENLIENALRHCSSGAVVRVGAQRVASGIEVRVTDTGSGIAPADINRVFDRFYQSNRNQGGSSGAGLGLAITKRILELHGVAIKLQSTLGSGTTFYFVLPVTT